MENFINAEIAERKAIKHLTSLFNDIEILEISQVNDYSDNDFIAVTGKTYFMGEVKIRTFNTEKYPTAIIELDKVNRLMNKNEEQYRLRGQQLYYFAFYREDRRLLVFDMINTPSTLTYEWCPISTMDPSRGNKYKAMVNYDINKAIINVKY
jgi:Holliday junction resolvase-like predicted endonuclease